MQKMMFLSPSIKNSYLYYFLRNRMVTFIARLMVGQVMRFVSHPTGVASKCSTIAPNANSTLSSDLARKRALGQ